MISHILFVCTGNTCRSPMAEGMLREMLNKAGLEIEVRSAGVTATNGMPISEQSSRILINKGIQDELTSKAVTGHGVEAADLILTMTMNHKRYLIEKFPQIIDKVYTLKEYADNSPADQSLVQEREQLIAELQLKLALSQEISKDEQERLLTLDRNMPDYDVMDPFGGSMNDYQICADEIEQSLRQILIKLKG